MNMARYKKIAARERGEILFTGIPPSPPAAVMLTTLRGLRRFPITRQGMVLEQKELMKIQTAPTGLHEKAQGIALGEEDIRMTWGQTNNDEMDR